MNAMAARAWFTDTVKPLKRLCHRRSVTRVRQPGGNYRLFLIVSTWGICMHPQLSTELQDDRVDRRREALTDLVIDYVELGCIPTRWRHTRAYDFEDPDPRCLHFFSGRFDLFLALPAAGPRRATRSLRANIRRFF